MTLEEFSYLGQVVGAVGVIASLVFLGFQVRASEKTQRALMHAQRTERGMQVVMFSAGLAKNIENMIDIEKTSFSDWWAVFSTFIRAQVLNVLDGHRQFEAGLLDRAAFDDMLAAVGSLFAIPHIRAIWFIVRQGQSPETVATIERLLIDKVATTPSPDVVAVWKQLTQQLLASSPTAATTQAAQS